MSFDPISGKIEIAFIAGDNHAEALSKRERSSEIPDKFNDLDFDTEIRGKYLVWKLYPNKLAGVMEILSGKLFIKKDLSVEDEDADYEAAVSFWQGLTAF